MFKAHKQPYEGGKKGGGSGREVHNIVAECVGLNVYFPVARVRWRARYESLIRGEIGCLGCFTKDGRRVFDFRKRFSCLTNENSAVVAEGLHKIGDLYIRSSQPFSRAVFR